MKVHRNNWGCATSRRTILQRTTRAPAPCYSDTGSPQDPALFGKGLAEPPTPSDSALRGRRSDLHPPNVDLAHPPDSCPEKTKYSRSNRTGPQCVRTSFRAVRWNQAQENPAPEGRLPIARRWGGGASAPGKVEEIREPRRSLCHGSMVIRKVDQRY